MQLAGEHQPEQGAVFPADHQDRSILAAGGVILVHHPGPDDLPGIRAAVEVRCVDHGAGPMCGGQAAAGDRSARSDRRGWLGGQGGSHQRFQAQPQPMLNSPLDRIRIR